MNNGNSPIWTIDEEKVQRVPGPCEIIIKDPTFISMQSWRKRERKRNESTLEVIMEECPKFSERHKEFEDEWT